jgi:aspartate aminotransferase
LREVFKENDLAHTWYQSSSAFYYLIDFSHAPVIEKYKTSENDVSDHSPEICEALLESRGVATVPGVAFGMDNSARMSLVMEKEPFKEALEIIVSFLNSKD